MNDVRITTLPSGLRVATDHMPGLRTASVALCIDVGSRHEPEGANGVAHLVEHMLFKGTARRSAFDIGAAVEGLGGYLNAYTDREQTTYYAKMLKDDLPTGLDVLADMVRNSSFDPVELDKERQVIVEEIGRAEDNPEDRIFDHWLHACYRDQPLGRPILGTADVIAALPRDEVAGYVTRNYTGANIVVAAAGGVDHDRVVEQAAKLFDGLPMGARPEPPPTRYVGGEARFDRDLEQLHIVLGFDGVSLTDPDYYAVQVLATLLGGGQSSRLFQEVREKRALVYSIYSHAWAMTDGGLFFVSAGCGPERAGELMPVVCDEILGVADSLTEAEVARARAQLKAGQLMAQEGTHARAEQMATGLFVFDRFVPPEEFIAKVDAVGVDDVARAARRVFASRPSLAALGPADGLDGYDRIAARLG